MDKSEKEILNNLSQQADQFEMPVEDFVWDAIVAEVQPLKKKRGLGLWWFGAAGLFMLVITLLAVIPFNANDTVTELNAGKEVRVNIPFTNKTVLAGAKTRQKQTETESGIALTETQNSINVASNARAINLMNIMVPISSDLNLKNSGGQKNEIGVEGVPTSERASPMDQLGIENATFAVVKEINMVDTLDLIATSNNVVLAETDSTIEEQTHIEQELAIVPIEKKKKGLRFTLLLHGGVGESFRVLKSATHHELITHKNEHETFGGCFEIGLDAQFKLGNRFIGRTGIGYKFYSDKYDFQHDLITHTTRNDYQYLQVPLIVGFNLLPRPKSNLYLLGGVRANLLTSAQSSWVDVAALAPVAHSNSSANTPFRSITAAVNLGFDFNYRFTDKFSIHLIPSVDAFLNSVYKRQTDLNQRPYSVNIDMGMSYSF